MGEKQTAIIIGVVLVIVAISATALSFYISDREFQLNNTAGQLEEILGICACKERVEANPDGIERCIQPFIDWENSTHYIDNNICKWQDLEK